MNSVNSKNKQSRIEVKVNTQILIIFFVQILLSLSMGLYAALWYETNKVGSILWSMAL